MADNDSDYPWYWMLTDWVIHWTCNVGMMYFKETFLPAVANMRIGSFDINGSTMIGSMSAIVGIIVFIYNFNWWGSMLKAIW
mmetsp:Transcript_40143/g.35434  ORF Transcript_40143/g.35434 Transcript_40143/m.35434 type:complete len:82 (+) Transcript_40143:276-521(+)